MKKYQIVSIRYKVLTAVFFCVLAKVSFAQTVRDTGKYMFSLNQCIDYALQNQHSIKNALLDEMIAKGRVKEVSGMGYPQINGSVQFSNNDPLRRMFTVGTGYPSFLTGNQRIPEGQVIAFPNF